MKRMMRRQWLAFVFAATIAMAPIAFAQGPAPTDLTGDWIRLITHEDAHERLPGPDPGEYWGLPLNDAARMRADSYNAEWLSTSLEFQCRPHPTGYQQLGPDEMRIERQTDVVTRHLTAYRILYRATPGDRMVWMDGRPRPSQNAAYTWEGFSTGHWDGDTLTINTTHLKESFIRRNGVGGSFRRTVTEHVSLDEPYMEWVLIVNDPDYLTEPLIRSVTFKRASNLEVPLYPCSVQPEEYRPEDAGKYRVPHYLIGENPYLTEVAFKYKSPLIATRGGAESMYPEFAAKLKGVAPPAAQFTLKPTYSDESTRIAERADAQPKRAPDYTNAEPEILHVNRNVYMVTGAGGNIALSVGGDGVVMVDSGVGAMTKKVLAAIEKLTQQFTPPPPVYSARPEADTWQATHTLAPALIRMIINTSADAEHVGGNDQVVSSRYYQPVTLERSNNSGAEMILAHENVLTRLQEMNTVPDAGLPINTYFTERYRLHRFFNGEGVEVMHLPKAHTDGDSMIWFRTADVIATGDVFRTDTYPTIDIDKGGSVQGEIDALIRIADMMYPEVMSQGGTLVIPGHGRICDVADVGVYRDMVIIVRDRIQGMIDKGMTLAQVKAAKPTMDFDPLYGREPGAAAQFVESVYRSLSAAKTAAKK
jgi:cyclase